MAGPWIWLEGIRRYRDLATGRFLSADRVQSFVVESMKQSSSAMDTLSSMVSNRQVNLQGWTRAMREEVRGEYIRQYILGRGGLEQMTQVDYGSLGGMLVRDYQYLDSFADDIAAGRLSEDDPIMRMVKLLDGIAGDAVEDRESWEALVDEPY